MQEHAIRAHRLEIPVPPYTSGPKLNGDPAIMWEAVTKEQNFLGELNASDRIVWFGMFPTGQYVPEPVPGQASDYAHFMLSPRDIQYMGQPTTKGRETFLSPDNLDESELDPASAFLLEFSRYPDTAFGYNIGSDPEAMKPSSQTWRNFHIQCLKLPEEVSGLEFAPKSLREPGHSRIEGYLSMSLADELSTADALQGSSVVHPDEVRRFGLNPHGAAVIDLGPDMTPQRLSAIMKRIHEAYGRVHEGWARTFFTNYDDVNRSGWSDTYVLRPRHEVMSGLAQGLTTDDLDFFSDYYDQVLPRLLADREDRLRTVSTLEQGEPIPPIPASSRVPFEGPTYSAAYVNRNGRMYSIVMPHLLRRAGSVEALGIEVKRVPVQEPGSVTYKVRKENAQRYFDTIACSDQVVGVPQ